MLENCSRRVIFQNFRSIFIYWTYNRDLCLLIKPWHVIYQFIVFFSQLKRWELLKSILGIVWENMALGTELPRIFCVGIGPLQLDVVLAMDIIMYYLLYA